MFGSSMSARERHRIWVRARWAVRGRLVDRRDWRSGLAVASLRESMTTVFVD